TLPHHGAQVFPVDGECPRMEQYRRGRPYEAGCPVRRRFEPSAEATIDIRRTFEISPGIFPGQREKAGVRGLQAEEARPHPRARTLPGDETLREIGRREVAIGFVFRKPAPSVQAFVRYRGQDSPREAVSVWDLCAEYPVEQGEHDLLLEHHVVRDEGIVDLTLYAEHVPQGFEIGSVQEGRYVEYRSSAVVEKAHFAERQGVRVPHEISVGG